MNEERDFLSLLDELGDRGYVRVSYLDAMRVMEFLMLHDTTFKCKTINNNSFIIKTLD
jgi:hypothetical protein